MKGIWGEEKGEMGMNMIICLCIYDIMIFSRTKKKFKGKDCAKAWLGLSGLIRSVEVPEPYHSGKALAFLVMRKKKGKYCYRMLAGSRTMKKSIFVNICS